MKRLFLLILTLTLTLAAVAPTQASNKKQSGRSGGYAKSVGPSQRQGGGYSRRRTIYSAPHHGGGRVYRSNGSSGRHSSKHGSRVRYY